MLRNLLIVIGILLGTVLIAAIYTLQTPRFWEKTLESYMKGRYQGISVTEVKIARVVWASDLTLGFEDVFLKLSIDNKDAFGKIQGALKGNVRVKWPGRVDVLNVQFDAPQGGEIKAELLGYLAQYIPQRQDLEELINNNKALFLDNAFIELVLLSTDKVSSHIKMYASKLNLNVNLNVDVNIDGGVEALMKRFNSSLKN